MSHFWLLQISIESCIIYMSNNDVCNVDVDVLNLFINGPKVVLHNVVFLYVKVFFESFSMPISSLAFLFFHFP